MIYSDAFGCRRRDSGCRHQASEENCGGSRRRDNGRATILHDGERETAAPEAERPLAAARYADRARHKKSQASHYAFHPPVRARLGQALCAKPRTIAESETTARFRFVLGLGPDQRLSPTGLFLGGLDRGCRRGDLRSEAGSGRGLSWIGLRADHDPMCKTILDARDQRSWHDA